MWPQHTATPAIVLLLVRLGAAHLTEPIVVAGRCVGEPKLTTTLDLYSPVLSDQYAYWKALNDHWGQGRTIINVEHDMEFNDQLVADLVECPHPLCTHAYRVYLSTRGYWVFSPTRAGRWIVEGDAWADTASLGFAKIAAGAQTRPLERMPWKWLEHAVNRAVIGWDGSTLSPCREARCAWHVHWPEIGHFHDYDAEAVTRASEFERFCLRIGVDGPLVYPSEQPTLAGSVHDS